jgi:divalent metal cation (Fe/Co/Zn/Cd) transporter
MVIEGTIAIVSGLRAHSVTLLAFGIDSGIELLSGVVLLWRLNLELRQGLGFSERTEMIASKIAGALLFALAFYVIVSGGWALVTHSGQEFSVAGLAVAVVAIPTMYWLARNKLRAAEQLASGALRADAIEAIACGWLSFVVVLGLVAQLLLRAWWVDGATSLIIVYFLIREGREAWEGDACCN